MAAATSDSRAGRKWPGSLDLWLAAALGVAVLAAYSSVFGAGFVWNDADYVTAPALRSLSGLWSIWFEVGATEQYYPILHSSFWVQQWLWGDAPLGYHLVNIALHWGSACLFALLLKRLAVPGAWVAAALFALHPVAVESVAWIAEQKNTLSLLFFLAAALAYHRYDEERTPGRYAVATALYALALLSKSLTATLPAALLVIQWWRAGRLDWRRDVAPLVPWLAAGAAFGIFSAWVEREFVGATGSDFALTAAQRLLIAGRAPWFYLGKLAWPADLMFIYPRWVVDAGDAWQWLFPAATAGAVLAAWMLRRRTRAPLAVALLFGGTLFPVLGFLSLYGFYFSFVADHWQYLPCLAPLALAGAGLSRLGKWLPVAGAGLGLAALLCVLGVLSWRQGPMYRDVETFYRAIIASNEACWMAHHNLGVLLLDSKRLDEAVAQFQRTLELKPDSGKVHNNLGSALLRLGRGEEALPFFEESLRRDGRSAAAHNNMATVLRDLKQMDEALRHHAEAVKAEPRWGDARNNQGVTLRAVGRAEEALQAFREAVRLDPESPQAHLNLALSLSLIGRDEESMQHYREARRLNPALPELK